MRNRRALLVAWLLLTSAARAQYDQASLNEETEDMIEDSAPILNPNIASDDSTENDLGPLKMGVYLATGQNFLTYPVLKEEDGITYEGFEVELLKELYFNELSQHRAEVKMIALPTAQDRIYALQNGTVDFVIGAFFVTPEREEQVDFLKPYYYSSGVALFAPNGTIPGVNNWTDLVGETVTINSGHYAVADLAKAGINLLTVQTRKEAADAINAGKALAFVDVAMSSSEDVGLSMVASIPQIYIRPVGVAVKNGSAEAGTPLAEELEEALQAVIKGGLNATILQIEQRAIEMSGMHWIKPNPDLRELVLHPDEPSFLWP